MRVSRHLATSRHVSPRLATSHLVWPHLATSHLVWPHLAMSRHFSACVPPAGARPLQRVAESEGRRLPQQRWRRRAALVPLLQSQHPAPRLPHERDLAARGGRGSRPRVAACVACRGLDASVRRVRMSRDEPRSDEVRSEHSRLLEIDESLGRRAGVPQPAAARTLWRRCRRYMTTSKAVGDDQPVFGEVGVFRVRRTYLAMVAEADYLIGQVGCTYARETCRLLSRATPPLLHVARLEISPYLPTSAPHHVARLAGGPHSSGRCRRENLPRSPPSPPDLVSPRRAGRRGGARGQALPRRARRLPL